MFERFRAAYAPRRDASQAGTGWRPRQLADVSGYAAFAHEFAGASFGQGLYRVHDDQTGPQALELVADAFPEVAKRAWPFGYDWLGRQFAIDSDRTVTGEPQVLLCEPGTGEVLEIPVSFSSFHDDELTEHPDAALASEFFNAWMRANLDALPLRRDQCAGYRIPLFLGGLDTIENLDVSDVEVYWSIIGQLRRQAL